MNPDQPPSERLPSAQRPTLADYAAEARGSAGLECHHCGCRDFRVVKTQRGAGVVVRRRECRHCGERVTTIEQ